MILRANETVVFSTSVKLSWIQPVQAVVLSLNPLVVTSSEGGFVFVRPLAIAGSIPYHYFVVTGEFEVVMC